MTAISMASQNGRAVLVRDGHLIDIAERSQGRFGPNPMTVLADWRHVCDWGRDQTLRGDEAPVDVKALDACVPRPRSIFAIGLNYRDHAAEAGLDVPGAPMVFTKFPSCLAGPAAAIPLTSDRVDWEAELVVVIGEGGRRISESDAWSRVAGLCCGQDISDRRRQFSDKPAQFSLGKSAQGFGPIGPAIVPLDAIANPDDLAITCAINDEVMQDSRTSQMIFSIPQIVAFLSSWCELAPGDLIFTGTPAGVGSVRTPRRYLQAGDVITTSIENVGVMRNVCRASDYTPP